MKSRKNKINKRKQTRRRRVKKCCQKGGGLLFNLIPSNVKLIGYFFVDGLKSSYNNLMGNRIL